MRNAIIFYYWNDKLTGSVINLFEYFLCMYQYNKNIEIIFVNGEKEGIDKFIRIMYDRYDIKDLAGFESNLKIVKRYKLMYEQFDRALVLDFGTISEIKGLIRVKDLIVISEKKTEEPEFFFSKDLYPVTYYGEMPFHYKDQAYRMKMLFDRYKKLESVKPKIFLNSPHNDKRDFVKRLDLPPDKPIIYKTRDHRKNLFEQFDTYVYYHANKWFDPHPRLFVESAFYDKEIVYYNFPGVKDGSYYRYHDVMEYGIQNRNLDKEDVIVRLMTEK